MLLLAGEGDLVSQGAFFASLAALLGAGHDTSIDPWTSVASRHGAGAARQSPWPVRSCQMPLKRPLAVMYGFVVA